MSFPFTFKFYDGELSVNMQIGHLLFYGCAIVYNFNFNKVRSLPPCFCGSLQITCSRPPQKTEQMKALRPFLSITCICFCEHFSLFIHFQGGNNKPSLFPKNFYGDFLLYNRSLIAKRSSVRMQNNFHL